MVTPRRSLSRAFLAGTTALLLAGCGEGSGDEASGTSDASSGMESASASTASTATDTNGSTDTSADTSSESSTDTETTSETGTDTGVPESGCGQTIAGGGTVAGFNTLTLNIGDDEYKVQTNPWGGADQTITVGGSNIFTVDSITHPGGAEPWEVAAFPSVYRGTPYGGDATVDSGMPIRVGDITGVNTGLRTNATQSNYQGNATYDVYFSNSETYTGGPPDVYMMVWFDAKGLNPINSPGEGWSCSGDAPNFIEACSAAGSVSIEGRTFHRFVGPNGSSNVISYVAETRMNEWEFDLNNFIQDAVTNGPLNSDMYLQGVQAGFELADAGAGLTIEEFCVEAY